MATPEAIVSWGGRWRGWLARAGRPGRQLRLVESLSLGERRFVAVVAAGERQFLIGATPQAMTLLSELTELRAGERV